MGLPARRFYYQSVFSVTAYSFILFILGIRLTWGIFDYDPSKAVIMAALLCGMSLVFLILSRSGTHTHLYLRLQPALGVSGVAALVYFSGGLQSNLMFAYLIPSFGAVLVSIPYALTTGLGALATLGGVIYLESAGVFPAVAKSGYSGQELLVVHLLRNVALQAIVIAGCAVYFAHIMGFNRRSLDERDEAVYTLASNLSRPLTKARDMLQTLSSDTPSLPLRHNAAELNVQLNEALKTVGEILQRLEAAPVPLTAQRVSGGSVTCAGCRRRIGFLRRYYGLPKERYYPELHGPYRNDIHCVSCHETSPAGCVLCAAWAETRQAAAAQA